MAKLVIKIYLEKDTPEARAAVTIQSTGYPWRLRRQAKLYPSRGNLM